MAEGEHVGARNQVRELLQARAGLDRVIEVLLRLVDERVDLMPAGAGLRRQSGGELHDHRPIAIDIDEPARRIAHLHRDVAVGFEVGLRVVGGRASCGRFLLADVGRGGNVKRSRRGLRFGDSRSQ